MTRLARDRQPHLQRRSSRSTRTSSPWGPRGVLGVQHRLPRPRPSSSGAREVARRHSPFTAEDVVFTYETTINPRPRAAYKYDFADVESVEAPDPYTVASPYKQPYAKALAELGQPTSCRAICSRRTCRRGSSARRRRTGARPVGTGPYRFRELKSGEKIVLVANPDYFRGAPYLSRVVYRIIPSQATIFLELKANGRRLRRASPRSSTSARPTIPAFKRPTTSSATRRRATPTSASTSAIRASRTGGCGRRSPTPSTSRS